MNITNFWGGRALSSRGSLRAAASSCAWSIILLACADEEPRKSVVVPRDEPDSGTTSPNEMFPDSGVTSQSEVCIVTADFVEEHKACTSDADCTVFEYQPKCCVEVTVVGLARADLKAAQDCSDAKDTVCNCPKGLSRTDDGRVVTESSPATVQCVNNQCVSSVSQRQCGASRSCGPGEICVTYENVPNGFPPDPDSKDNVLQTFRCEPNPCGLRLACECAQRLCDARNDTERMCEIKNNAESDLHCGASE